MSTIKTEIDIGELVDELVKTLASRHGESLGRNQFASEAIAPSDTQTRRPGRRHNAPGSAREPLAGAARSRPASASDRDSTIRSLCWR